MFGDSHMIPPQGGPPSAYWITGQYLPLLFDYGFGLNVKLSASTNRCRLTDICTVIFASCHHIMPSHGTHRSLGRQTSDLIRGRSEEPNSSRRIRTRRPQPSGLSSLISGQVAE